MSASAHWIRANDWWIAVHAVCIHSVSGSFEIRWVHLPPTLQALHVTIAHTYIAMMMRKRYMVQIYYKHRRLVKQHLCRFHVFCVSSRTVQHTASPIIFSPWNVNKEDGGSLQLPSLMHSLMTPSLAKNQSAVLGHRFCSMSVPVNELK